MGKEDSNVWEAKDLRISKLAIVKAIFDKTSKWDEGEEKLADEMLAYVYRSKGDKVNKLIEEHESKQQPF